MMTRSSTVGRPLVSRATWLGLALVACVSGPAPAGEPERRLPGFVDGAKFVELAGDDAVTLEVNLSGALLRAVTAIDPELQQAAGGVQSIHAVVLELDDGPTATRLRQEIAETERGLLSRGWERLARVRESDAEVKVLARTAGDMIEGLVVMIVDEEERNLVFANLAGTLDLAAIERIGGDMELPGLDRLTPEAEGEEEDRGRGRNEEGD